MLMISITNKIHFTIRTEGRSVVSTVHSLDLTTRYISNWCIENTLISESNLLHTPNKYFTHIDLLIIVMNFTLKIGPKTFIENQI